MSSQSMMRSVMSRALAFGLFSASAFAGEFAVEKNGAPIPFLAAESTKVDGVIEASAIASIGDGSLVLIAHDKTTEMFVAELSTGQIVGKPLTTPKFPNGAKIPPKWEGLARDREGFVYVIGTHGGKTDEERPSRSFLFKFRLTGGTAGSPVAIDEASVTRFRIEDSLKSVLSESVKSAKAVDKRKIEGLAIREIPASGNQAASALLAVGLREPGDLVRVLAADITKTPANDDKLELRPLFQFDAGQREGVQSQLTSLEYVPEWEGFVVATATEDDQNIFHGNTLWFVSDAQIAAGTTVKPQVIDVFEPAMKVEGIAAIVSPEAHRGNGNPNTVRFVLSFDNDPHTTHIPSRMQQVVITKRSRD